MSVFFLQLPWVEGTFATAGNTDGTCRGGNPSWGRWRRDRVWGPSTPWESRFAWLSLRSGWHRVEGGDL